METESRLPAWGERKVGQWWLRDIGFLFEMVSILKCIEIMAAQLCENAKCHTVMHLSREAIWRMNYIWKSYFKNQSNDWQDPGSCRTWQAMWESLLLLWDGCYWMVLSEKWKDWIYIWKKALCCYVENRLKEGQAWKQAAGIELLAVIQVRGAGGSQQALEAGE